MKESTVIVLLVAGFAVLFWAFSKGFISASPTGLGINPSTGQAYGVVNVPQPSTNYSGYLAASTAPGVSSALNQIFGGIGTGLSSWLSGGGSSTPVVNQGPIAPPASAPSASAQPTGPTPSGFFSGASANPVLSASAAVGPAIAPDLSYDATQNSAFDYAGLSSANAFDPNYSLMDPGYSV